MRTLRLAAVSCFFFLGLVAGAQASNITVGASLNSLIPLQFGTVLTATNTSVTGPNPIVSPVDGAIVGWSVQDASGGPFYLRVLTPAGTLQYTGAGKSAPAMPKGASVEKFSAALPIKAGQTIGIENSNGSDEIGIVEGGAFALAPSGTVAEGSTAQFTIGFAANLAFNAEIQPLPSIAALEAASGPTSGGTSVLISGADLTGASSVKFGGLPATFSQVSESAVLATSPADATAGPAPVTVTTPAGTAASPQTFTYVAPTAPAPSCKVPKLKGKKLNGAKKALGKADCKLGKVKKKKGVTAKTGKVVKQGKKPGSKLVAGAKVPVTLG